MAHLKQTSPQVAEAAGAPKPVQVQTVARAPLDQVLGAEATAVESQLVPIRINSQLASITQVAAKPGDIVLRGQLLLLLDDSLPKAKLESAQRDLANANNDLILARQQTEVFQDLGRRQLASDSEVLAVTRQQAQIRDRIVADELQVQEAMEALKVTRVVAPVSGMVTDGELHAGMVVRGGIDLMTISAIDPIYVTAKLGQDKIQGIYAGQAADVSLYAFPDRRFEGTVVLIKPTVDNQTRLVSAVVRVDNPGLEIKPGMNGVARLKSTREGVRAPAVAVISSAEGSRYVFVVGPDGVARIRPVTVGAESEGYFAIESGLNAGERVVVVGQAALTDNEAVRIGTEYAKGD